MHFLGTLLHSTCTCSMGGFVNVNKKFWNNVNVSNGQSFLKLHVQCTYL